jgi:hypothetical protein
LPLEPAEKNVDLVRPGEQWFFYWKTSAALWEGRIQQIPPQEVIFLPLNWGFHAASADEWDFGQTAPERDLLRLVQLLGQHRRRFCWLLPLAPSPFLPNGGLPVHATRNLSLNRDGVHLSVLDHEQKLHKIYSWFDPRAFAAYTGFLNAFGEFLSRNSIRAPIWGTQHSYWEGERRVSYFEDHSVAFEQGLSRYLKRGQTEGVELGLASVEEELRERFTAEVRNLFRSAAEEHLAPYWAGIQEVIFLGGAPLETVERSLSQGKSESRYFKDLFAHRARNDLFSSVLLTPSEKGQLFGPLIEGQLCEQLEERYRFRPPTGTIASDWRPLGLVDLFDVDLDHFREVGLVSYLDRQFSWLYQLHQELPFTPEWIAEHQHKVKFFHGRALDRTRFGQMLKLFMMGEKIVLDKSGLAPELEKRLQLFLLENDLRPELVNFLTTITLCELGEGKFIMVDGGRLPSRSEGERLWGHIFRFLRLSQPELVIEPEVYGLWQIRDSGPGDLNYLDVRRVNLFNPTSYKKQVRIHTQKHFAFMRSVDAVRSQAKSTTEGVEVELLPGGTVGLDFGHYEEAR